MRDEQIERLAEALGAWGREPYILADLLCQAQHPETRMTMTRFGTPDRFVVSCAGCKADAYVLLPLLTAELAPVVDAMVAEAWDEARFVEREYAKQVAAYHHWSSISAGKPVDPPNPYREQR